MITLTMSWDILPGRRGIDNVYGSAGRIYSPTTAGLYANKHNPSPHTHTHR